MSDVQLSKNEQYAIVWCFNRAILQYEDDGRDIVVNGININQTIKNLLGRLFI